MSEVDRDPPRRRSSVGCLGLLMVPTMALVSLILGGALLWLNPGWLEEVAWWRPPPTRVAPYTVPAPVDAGELAHALSLPDPEPPRPRVPRDGSGWLRLESASRTVAYDPDAGARIVLDGGSGLEVPAGALPEPGTLSLTPVASMPDAMAHAFIGPIVDLRFDHRDHFRFARPARLALPCAPGFDPEGGSLMVWEDGAWKPVASRWDPERRVFTAEIDHASVWAVATVAVPPPVTVGLIGATLWAATNGSMRAAAKSVAWVAETGYETPEGNFQFHYALTGPHRVPTDMEYLRAIGRPIISGLFEPEPGVPLYVQDLGYLLEYCRQELERMGLPLPEPDLFLYDVFLEPLENAFGRSGLGGPLVLHARLDEAAAQAHLPLYDLMRSACAHELVHVAQGDGYSDAVAFAEAYLPDGMGPQQRWWLEMSAEFLANHMWETVGEPLGSFALRFEDDPKLPATSMIGAPDPQHYAYAGFLRWIDARFGEGRAWNWIRRVDQAWFSDPVSIDAAARAEFGGSGLGELFRAFAFDFFHYDLEDGILFPQFHDDATLPAQVRAQSDASFDFACLARQAVLRSGSRAHAGRVVDYRQRGVWLHALDPLSARAVYFLFDGFGPEDRAKLVVRAVAPGEVGSVPEVYFAAQAVAFHVPYPRRYDVPFLNSMGRLGRLEGPGSMVVLDLREEDAPQHATLLVLNRSLEQPASRVRVERWLLLPPGFLSYRREADGRPEWQLRWEAVELKSQPAFRYYRVYRKPTEAGPEAYVPVLETKEEWARVVAPDLGAYEFTVRAVDREGNESHDATLDDRRFLGRWSGTLRLSGGSLVTGLKSSGSPRWATSARERVPLGDIPFLEGMSDENFFLMLEQGLKAGLPVELEIREQEGRLDGRLRTFGGLDFHALPFVNQWQPLLRRGTNSVSLAGLPPRVQSEQPVLSLVRYDHQGGGAGVIRCDNWRFFLPFEPGNPAAGAIDVRLSLRCERGERGGLPAWVWAWRED